MYAVFKIAVPTLEYGASNNSMLINLWIEKDAIEHTCGLIWDIPEFSIRKWEKTTKMLLRIFGVQTETAMDTFPLQVTCWANALCSRWFQYMVSYIFNEKHKVRYDPG